MACLNTTVQDINMNLAILAPTLHVNDSLESSGNRQESQVCQSLRTSLLPGHMPGFPGQPHKEQK